MSFLEKIRIRLDKVPSICLAIACVGQIFVWSLQPGEVKVWKVVLLIATLLLDVMALYHVLRGTKDQEHTNLFLRVWIFALAFGIIELVVCRLLGSIVCAIVGVVLLLLMVDLRPLLAPAAAKSGKAS